MGGRSAALDSLALASAAKSGPSLRSAGAQITVLFGLLVAVQFAAAISLPVGNGWIWDPRGTATFGSSLAWAPLLAVWAVFGPLRAAVRLPLTVWLAVAVNLVEMYALNRSMGEDGRFIIYICTATWLLAFAVLQVPLWLIRSLCRFRLERPAEAASGPASKSASQSSLRAILGWTVAAAVLLAAYRAIAPNADPGMAEEILLEVRWMCFLAALGGLPVVALAWIMLCDGRRPLLRIVLCLLIVLGIAIACALFANANNGLTPDIVIVLEGGAVLNGLFSFWIVRVCGYRLRRHSRESATAAAPTLAPPAPTTRRRFVIAAVPLVAIAAGLVCSIPHRLETWRRGEISADWSRWSGINVSFDDEGKIVGAHYLQRYPIMDDTCSRLASLADLRELSLAGSPIDDRQLALLAPISRLTNLDLSSTMITDQGLEQLVRFPEVVSLNLSNTAITDAGLEHLKSLPKLQTLRLSHTDVSNRGLEALAQLPALRSIDAQLTAVTAAGAERFHQANPRATVKCGASDMLLTNWQTFTRIVTMNAPGNQTLGHFDELVKVRILYAQGKAVINGIPTGVTDAGLATLAFQTDLEVLDLRDSEVTDQGIIQLQSLKSLKRLDLRGSPVTEQGVANLARAMPGCEILR